MKILVVEDESLVREVLAADLADAGHRIVQALNADEAIRALDSDIDVLVTDIDMPGSMDGLALAFLVSDNWPPIKIIIASGKHKPLSDEMPEGAAFLAKPYFSRQVLDAISRLA